FLILGSLGISASLLCALYIGQETVEEELCILGATVCFRVELDGKAVPFLVLDAFTGTVVGIDLGHNAHFGGQLVPHHRIAVVLAGDEAAAAGKIGHGLVEIGRA